MASHYISSGWLEREDEDGLIDLVSRGASEGALEPLSGDLEYRVLPDRDAQFQFWLFAAHGQIRGAVPFVRPELSWPVVVDRLLPRVTGGMGAVELRRADQEGPKLCVELADFGRLVEGETGGTHEARITGLAYICRTVPREEEHLCIPRLDPFGLRYDVSVSMGEGSRCDLLACGRITRARRVTNELTGHEVWLVTLDTPGLPLCVATSPASLEGDPPEAGRLFEGVYWLVGQLARPGGKVQSLTSALRRKLGRDE
jgi:hypothetical protein